MNPHRWLSGGDRSGRFLQVLLPAPPPSLTESVEEHFLELLVVRMLLVAMPGAPSSVLAPSSKARSPQ